MNDLQCNNCGRYSFVPFVRYWDAHADGDDCFFCFVGTLREISPCGESK